MLNNLQCIWHGLSLLMYRTMKVFVNKIKEKTVVGIIKNTCILKTMHKIFKSI